MQTSSGVVVLRGISTLSGRRGCLQTGMKEEWVEGKCDAAVRTANAREPASGDGDDVKFTEPRGQRSHAVRGCLGIESLTSSLPRMYGT